MSQFTSVRARRYKTWIMNTLFEQNQPAPPHQFGNRIIAFVVFGKPVPQGSSKAFYVPKLGRSVITSANKNLRPWRQMISETAMALNVTPIPKPVPVEMSLDFYFRRPVSLPKARTKPTVRPDTDKLIRAILDSLTGILYDDDAQVVRFTHIEKHYGDVERVEISLSEAV